MFLEIKFITNGKISSELFEDILDHLVICGRKWDDHCVNMFGFLKSDGKKIYIFRFLNPCKYCLVDVSILFNPVFGKTYILHSLLKTIPDAEVEIKVIDDEGHEFKVHDYLKNYSNIIKELLKIENTLTYSR